MSFALIGLILVVDQLLVPMFHIGPFPYKISYLLLGLWLGDWVLGGVHPSQRRAAADFLRAAIAISIIVGCALVGEVILAFRSPPSSYGEAVRSVLIYVLATLSFGLGLSARRFQLKWLIVVLFVSIGLNLAFVFLRTGLPAWLINFYYSQRDVNTVAISGVSDVAGMLDLTRPRGLFSNPNVSALMVNIVALFIHLAWRKRLLGLPGALVGMAVVVLPVVLTAVLASRGEFLVASVLAFLNLRLMFGAQSIFKRIRVALVAGIIGLVAVAGSSTLRSGESPLQNLERILQLRNIFDVSSGATEEDQATGGLARPLIGLVGAWDRFSTSPLVGTGFSVGQAYPFDFETQYFHNDWFRLLVTSGPIGVAAMLWLIRRFCWPLGWPAIIPFVLPGLVNTFQLNIPAFMFYFFMVGVLRAKLMTASPDDSHAH
jgi:hypothetical protein